MNILSEDKSQNRIMADRNVYGLWILNQKIFPLHLAWFNAELATAKLYVASNARVSETLIGNVAFVVYFAVLF
jgi:hypothetical protein